MIAQFLRRAGHVNALMAVCGLFLCLVLLQWLYLGFQNQPERASVRFRTVGQRPIALALEQSGHHSPSDGLRFFDTLKSFALGESHFVTRRVTAT
jgi:hypothetical protein